MKYQTAIRMPLAGLVVAALLFVGLSAGASIVPPYATDANTLHLWHLDESAVPAVDAVSSPPGINCINLSTGCLLYTSDAADE